MNLLSAKFKLVFDEFIFKVDLEIPVHGFTVLFGPSGSGKTSFLRCISGLERSPEGFLRIGDETWQDEKRGIFVPTSERQIGYVFQETRLFPHLNVEGNLRYGLKRCTPQNGDALFSQVVEIMGLGPLLSRHSGNLSGGEKQRVALARALLTRPRLLLMDEPLAALDTKRKQEILPYFQRMQSELSIPVFYVSHSLNEVLQLVDTLLLMDQGKIVAAGPVEDVFSHPNLGRHLGHSLVGTVLGTTVVRQDEEFQLTVLKFNDHILYVPRRDVYPGNRLRVHIRAEDVTLAVAPIEYQTSVLNVLPAQIVEVRSNAEDGCKVDVTLDIGCPLLASITRKSLAHLNLQSGQNIYAHIKAIRMAHELD